MSRVSTPVSRIAVESPELEDISYVARSGSVPHRRFPTPKYSRPSTVLGRASPALGRVSPALVRASPLFGATQLVAPGSRPQWWRERLHVA